MNYIYIYIYIIFKQTKYYQRQLFNDDPYLKIYSPNILANKSIKGNYKSYNPNSKRCSLCLHKKLEIVDHPKEILLSKRSEVISKCCHRNIYKLKTLVSNKRDRVIT